MSTKILERHFQMTELGKLAVSTLSKPPKVSVTFLSGQHIERFQYLAKEVLFHDELHSLAW